MKWKENVAEILNSKMAKYFWQRSEIGFKAIGMCGSTYRDKRRDPKTITLGDLQKMNRALHFTDEELLIIAKGE